MIETKTCPKCGVEVPVNAPQGICPRCLMGAGVAMAEKWREAARRGGAETTPPPNGFVPPPPESLAPHFPQLEIAELLGHGGMGAVYKARQTKLDRLVALKIIRPESAHDQLFAERFTREARTLARLSHPNIVAVHDFGEVNLSPPDGVDSANRTLYYFLMEYVDGANVRQLLEAGELNSERALAIVPQICEALQFAHDEGIVHRDIKPDNILVDTRGRVKIADFGLAKLMSDEVTDHTLTASHQVMGTPRYMAPEQMEGARAVDHRADIYSLGVVLYEMLTGELPLGRFDPPSQKASIDAEWDKVVLRALEKEPDRRYQHASEVKSEVERVSDLDQPPVMSAVPKIKNPAGAALDQRTQPHYGMLMMGVVMGILGVALLTHPELERTHLFLIMGTLIALGGGGCLVAAFSLRLPRGSRVVAGRLAQGGILIVMGTALLLFCYLRQGGWFVGNLGIWTGIGLIHAGGGFLIAAWKRDVTLAAMNAENAEHGSPRTSKLEFDQTAPHNTSDHLLNSPSIGLMVAGAINCLCALPWGALLCHAKLTNRRIFGGGEEHVAIWLFSCAVIGIPILFAALKMRQLEAYRLSLLGTILAILPVTPGALIGLPMGLWALAVLTRKDVRAAFEESQDFAGRPHKEPKLNVAAHYGPQFSRKAIVGACWAPFFLFFLLSFFTTTTTTTVGPEHLAVSTDGPLVETMMPASQPETLGPAWWQWILIVTVIPLGLTAPFGTTVLGIMSISNIRHSQGRLIGMPLAVADALFYPLLLLDCLIFVLSNILVLAVLSLTVTAGPRGLSVLAVIGPGMLLSLPVCIAVDFFIARVTWRKAISGWKGAN